MESLQLMENSNVWGEWTFSPEAQAKINSLFSNLGSESKTSCEEDEAWNWLINKVDKYRLLKESSKTLLEPKLKLSEAKNVEEEEPMEVSLQSKSNEPDSPEHKETDSTMVVEKDSVILLLTAFDTPEPNKNNILDVIKDVPDCDLLLVLQEVWPQLTTDSKKLCLCEQLTESTRTSSLLCQHFLLPWLSGGNCTCIEAVSVILPQCADVVCKSLILPILASKESPFVTDIFALKDLTLHLQADHWCVILSEFIRSMDSGLEKWHLPVIAVGIESAKNARKNLIDDLLNVLIVLMRCHVKDFAKDRDFGNIIIACINCLSADSSSFLVKQIVDLVQTYSGPLRYKAISLIKSLNG